MPIAKVQLPDGKIARFEVDEGTTPEQVIAFAQNELSIPDNPPSSTTSLDSEILANQQTVDRQQLEHTPQGTPREQLLADQFMRQPSSLDDVMGRIKPDIRPGMSASEPPSMAQRIINKMIGSRGEVNPQSEAKAIIAFEAFRQGKTAKQYVEEVGPRTGPLERGLKDFGSGAISTAEGLLGFATRLNDEPAIEDLRLRLKDKAEGLFPSDPNFADQVMAGFGSTATFYIPGMGIAKGLQAVSKVSSTMALWLGGGAAAGLEAAVESGMTYTDMLSNGRGADEAKRAADKVFFENIPLLVVTNKMGLFGERGSRLTRKSLSAVIEGTQEGGQQVISNEATGRPLGEGVVESIGVGAIVGGGLGGTFNTPQENLGKELQRGITEGQLNPVDSLSPDQSILKPVDRPTEQLSPLASKEELKTIKDIRLKRQYTVEETGDTVEVMEKADKLISDIDSRADNLKALMDCLS